MIHHPRGVLMANGVWISFVATSKGQKAEDVLYPRSNPIGAAFREGGILIAAK